MFTKKSTAVETKRQQQALAKQSRRYINTISTYAQNAETLLEESLKGLDGKNGDEKAVHYESIIHVVFEQIKGIRKGLETSIEDWEDMMEPKDVEAAHMPRVDLTPFNELIPKNDDNNEGTLESIAVNQDNT